MEIAFESAHSVAGFPDNHLRINIRAEDAEGPITREIWFSVPPDFHVHNDSVAATLATFCGTKYDTISLNFPISDHCEAALARHCSAAILKPGAIAPRVPGTEIGLSFSGGFDSLAAHLLAPNTMKLISLDFGMRFKRERTYFETHRPAAICTTNFREEGFWANDWRFMASAAILHADYLNLGTIAFGSILEATPWNFAPARSKKGVAEDPLYAAAGLVGSSPIRGLTEFGTAMVLDARGSNEIEPSLASLADPGTEKLFRKRLLIDTVRYEAGGPLPPFETYAYPRVKPDFGQSFAVDFLALYFLKLYGYETVGRWMSGLDAPDLAWLSDTDLRFYCRYNPNFITSIPERMRNEVLSGYHECGIYPYDEYDWTAFETVRAFLAQYHQVPL